jgi:hypothetical protein
MLWHNNILHPLFVIIASCGGFYFGNAFLGGLAMFIFYLGRELTQAEYKWIQTYGQGKRKNMPWYGALYPSVWDTHSFWWNLTLPSIIVLVIGAVT